METTTMTVKAIELETGDLGVRWMHNGVSLFHAFPIDGRKRVALCGTKATNAPFAEWRGLPGSVVLRHADDPKRTCAVCMTEVRDLGMEREMPTERERLQMAAATAHQAWCDHFDSCGVCGAEDESGPPCDAGSVILQRSVKARRALARFWDVARKGAR